MSQLLIDIVTHLRKLGNKEIPPINLAGGICEEIDRKFDYEIDSCVFETWPKFSGNYDYPIPMLDSQKETYQEAIKMSLRLETRADIDKIPAKRLALRAFHCCQRELWNYDETGDIRRELCLWLADYYEENGL